MKGIAAGLGQISQSSNPGWKIPKAEVNCTAPNSSKTPIKVYKVWIRWNMAEHFWCVPAVPRPRVAHPVARKQSGREPQVKQTSILSGQGCSRCKHQKMQVLCQARLSSLGMLHFSQNFKVKKGKERPPRHWSGVVDSHVLSKALG